MFIGSYYYVIPDHIPSLNVTSVYYLVFLFFSFVLIRMSKGVLNQILLLLCSAFFIWTFSIKALIFVASIAVLGYIFGLILYRFKTPLMLMLSIMPFVGLLGYLKYFSESPILPLGLSFYSFKVLSYLADVYKEKHKAENNPLVFANYVLFFPCITSGPIHRYDAFKSSLTAKKEFEYSEFSNGFVQVLLGIFEKIVFCDYIAYVISLGFNGDVNGFTLLMCIFLYSFQIYLDFDAVSNIAIGSARILGFNVGRNFNSPYLASTIKEFWRRWHISLSSWLRDYVYIPLGGSHKGRIRTYVNLMATFVISGVWHGSTWSFLLWGVLHGTLQIIEDLLIKSFKNIELDKDSRFFLKIIGIAFNFVLVSFLWLVFRCQTINEVVSVLSRISFNGSFNLPLTHNEIMWLAAIVLIVVVTDILRENFDVIDFITHLYGIKWLIYFALIVVFLIFGVYGGSYEATDFIYQFF